jgi:hypothetical protein
MRWHAFFFFFRTRPAAAVHNGTADNYCLAPLDERLYLILELTSFIWRKTIKSAAIVSCAQAAEMIAVRGRVAKLI